MLKIKNTNEIILASGSQTRQKMLKNIGIDFKIALPQVDEDDLKKKLIDLRAQELGLSLADAKAKSIVDQFAQATIIAADQLCVLDNEIFDKPGNRETCIKHLKILRGKTHQQICSLALYNQGQQTWLYQDQALVSIRNLSDKEIEAYVDLEQPFQSCGAYMLEQHGKHIFSQIQGDHDTVLGLPLIALVNKLYELQVIELLTAE